MSKLHSLITDLCPRGVASVRINDLIAYEQPTKYLVASKSYDDSYPTPVLTAGQSFLLGYTNEEHGKYPASADSPVIIFDDFTTAYKWVDFEFKVKSSAMKMLTVKPDAPITLRYFWYALSTISIDTSEHARYWISKFSNLDIPLPPVAIQNEIVRILDTFGKLEAALEEELKARTTQYQTYRRQLLTSGKNQSQFAKHTLGGISLKVTSGSTPLADSERFYKDGTIPWLRTQEVKFNEIWETEVKVTDVALKETGIKWVPENSVIIAISGATAGRSAVNKIPLTTNQHCCNFQIDPEKADYRYVFHWVAAHYEDIKSFGRGVRSDLSAGQLKEYPINLPSMQMQIEIATALEKFDKLTRDTSSGLPAEIAARRQQFEYYRSKLLAFKELEVA